MVFLFFQHFKGIILLSLVFCYSWWQLYKNSYICPSLHNRYISSPFIPFSSSILLVFRKLIMVCLNVFLCSFFLCCFLNFAKLLFHNVHHIWKISYHIISTCFSPLPPLSWSSSCTSLTSPSCPSCPWVPVHFKFTNLIFSFTVSTLLIIL